MAGADAEVQYVLGDYDVPPETHLLKGVVATGIVRLGDGCVCDGSVVGGRGVVLGKRVTVHGDVVSSGPVHFAQGCLVEGQIRALESLAPEANAGPAATDVDGRARTVQATLGLLLDMAWTAHRDGAADAGDGWYGLPWEATEQTLEGLRGLLAETYRGGDTKLPWSTDEVFNVLLKRVVGSVVPLGVSRRDEEVAVLTIAAPLTPGSAGGTRGWPQPVLSLIALVGKAVHPGFRLGAVEGKDVLGTEADPARIFALVTVGAPKAKPR